MPDFLLLSDTGPTVVDVKPRLQLSKPKVSFTSAWIRDLVEQHQWQYEVWSEPFEHGISRGGYIEAPRDPHLAYEFLATRWRTIQHYGVEIDSRRVPDPG